MIPNDFRLKHGLALKTFLSTDCGRDLIPVLQQLRPLFITNSTPHVHTESAGTVRGYELCIKDLVRLSELPKQPEEIEMTYGVESNQPNK